MSDREISPRDVFVRTDSRSRSPEERRSRDREEPQRRERKPGPAAGRSSRSRSPLDSRRRQHSADRERPQPSRCIGVFGLSIYTNERELRDFFSKYGRVEDVQIVYDAQTGRSRGFGFVYYESEDDANEAKEKANGLEIDNRKIRVDFSITKRAHTPTPGVYMGRPTRRQNKRGGSGGYNNHHHYNTYGGGGGGGTGRYVGGYRHTTRKYTRSPSPYQQRGGGGSHRYRERSYSPRRSYY